MQETRWSYISAEKQSVYSTATADWANERVYMYEIEFALNSLQCLICYINKSKPNYKFKVFSIQKKCSFHMLKVLFLMKQYKHRDDFIYYNKYKHSRALLWMQRNATLLPTLHFRMWILLFETKILNFDLSVPMTIFNTSAIQSFFFLLEHFDIFLRPQQWFLDSNTSMLASLIEYSCLSWYWQFSWHWFSSVIMYEAVSLLSRNLVTLM